jgi:hypothetical protein
MNKIDDDLLYKIIKINKILNLEDRTCQLICFYTELNTYEGRTYLKQKNKDFKKRIFDISINIYKLYQDIYNDDNNFLFKQVLVLIESLINKYYYNRLFNNLYNLYANTSSIVNLSYYMIDKYDNLLFEALDIINIDIINNTNKKNILIVIRLLLSNSVGIKYIKNRMRLIKKINNKFNVEILDFSSPL